MCGMKNRFDSMSWGSRQEDRVCTLHGLRDKVAYQTLIISIQGEIKLGARRAAGHSIGNLTLLADGETFEDCCTGTVAAIGSLRKDMHHKVSAPEHRLAEH